MAARIRGTKAAHEIAHEQRPLLIGDIHERAEVRDVSAHHWHGERQDALGTPELDRHVLRELPAPSRNLDDLASLISEIEVDITVGLSETHVNGMRRAVKLGPPTTDTL